MTLFDREHSILVEWLCSAEGAVTITGVLGKDAYEMGIVASDTANLSASARWVPRTKRDMWLSARKQMISIRRVRAELAHRVVMTPPARRVDRVVRPTGTILHTHVDSLPFTLIPARVEVTTDTGKRDGAQLFGFEQHRASSRR